MAQLIGGSFTLWTEFVPVHHLCSDGFLTCRVFQQLIEGLVTDIDAILHMQPAFVI